MTASVLWLFLTVPWVSIQYVIVVFPDHIHLFCLFFLSILNKSYRLLHSFFDPSPDLSPSRPYQPEPEGRGLILSEG